MIISHPTLISTRMAVLALFHNNKRTMNHSEPFREALERKKKEKEETDIASGGVIGIYSPISPTLVMLAFYPPIFSH